MVFRRMDGKSHVWIGLVESYTEESILSTQPKKLAQHIISAVSESDYMCLCGTPVFDNLSRTIDKIFNTLPPQQKALLLNEIKNQTKDNKSMYDLIKDIHDYGAEEDC